MLSAYLCTTKPPATFARSLVLFSSFPLIRFVLKGVVCAVGAIPRQAQGPKTFLVLFSHIHIEGGRLEGIYSIMHIYRRPSERRGRLLLFVRFRDRVTLTSVLGCYLSRAS